MKKALLWWGCALWAGMVLASPFSVGNQELIGGLGLDRDKAVRFDGYYGYYLMQGLSLGPQATYLVNPHANTWMLGARAVKNINLDKKLIPFVAFGVSYGSTKENNPPVSGASDDAAVFRGDVGAKYFIEKNLALSGALILEGATRELFRVDDKLERNNLSFEAAIHYLF